MSEAAGLLVFGPILVLIAFNVIFVVGGTIASAILLFKYRRQLSVRDQVDESS